MWIPGFSFLHGVLSLLLHWVCACSASDETESSARTTEQPVLLIKPMVLGGAREEGVQFLLIWRY